jgi:hypothetical protein
MAQCRECRFFGPVSPDKDGKARIRKDWTYPCAFPLGKIVYPDSVPERDRPTRKVYVLPDEGKRCPRFVKKGGSE